MQINSFYNGNVELPESEVRDEILSGKDKKLILFNDEVNTFDFIIEALVDICEHSPEQASQCTLIAHYKGKCIIKEGPAPVLQKMAKALSNLQITVEIN